MDAAVAADQNEPAAVGGVDRIAQVVLRLGDEPVHVDPSAVRRREDRSEHGLRVAEAGRARVDRDDRAQSDVGVGHISNVGPVFTITSDIRP